MTFGIMITTRNRCEDLRRTLEQVRNLNPPADEIWICADGCTDDTAMMVTKTFPSAQLIVHETGAGSVGSRNQMLRSMAADWVLSLDDDSYPLDEAFFAKAASLMAQHPEVSVFTFPELHNEGRYASPTKTPESPGHCVSAYPNCAALMNRADYLQVEGYPTFFFHNYEEPDYALQLFGAGKAVWFEPSLTIRHHFSSANRSHLRNHHLNARNELWSVWMRCPWPWLPLVSLFRVTRQFQHACSQGWDWMVKEPLWWLDALKGLPHCVEHRHAIPWSRYLAWMRLARRPLHNGTEITQIWNPHSS